ncbi:hypothetical protein RND81_06G129900 [Saponaria officinalis]|uniref:SWIM-type domain-containing protein n=1 Tax=Saponaria officinalis TaxID=3572 RepID=A0AAW1KB33_SAPOF
MEFESGEQFSALCFMYAYKFGFQFHVRSSDLLDVYKEKGVRRNGEGDTEAQFHMLKRIRLVCSKGRKSKTDPEHVPCKVFVDGRIKFGGDNFVITQCVLVHNHEIDPSTSRHVSLYRHIGEYFKKRMMLNDRAGIPMTKNFNTRYRMPFSPFVGVNHHGSTVIFAAALISYEDTEMFEWVFEKWVECMGRAPANADKNLQIHPQFTAIDRDMRTLVHESTTEEKFQGMWEVMVGKYNLQKNSWVKEAWLIRRRWVPVYWMDTFCAGMSSTQRSEQSNRYFKTFVSIETGLKQFIDQFEFALKRKAEEERLLNFADKKRPLKWDQGILFEDVFRKVYPNQKFQEVKDEVYGCINTNVETLTNVSGFVKMFRATSKVNEPFWKKERRCFDVSIDTLSGEYKCGCKLFEFKGIACRHIIKCLDVLDVKVIPDKYILDRWRKDLVRGYENIRIGYYDPGESERVKRSVELTVRSDYMTTLAMHDDEAYHIYMTKSNELIKTLEAHAGIENVDAFGEGNVSTRVWGRRRPQRKEPARQTAREEGDIRDPPDRRGNGRRRVPKQPKRRKTTTRNANPIPTSSADGVSSQVSGFSSSQIRGSQLNPNMSGSQRTLVLSTSQQTPQFTSSQFSQYSRFL